MMLSPSSQARRPRSGLYACMCAALFAVCAAPVLADDAPAPLLLLTFDEGLAADQAGGREQPYKDVGWKLVDGQDGKALHLGTGGDRANVAYGSGGNIDLARGTIEFSVRLDWDYTSATSRQKRVWLDVHGRGGPNRLYIHSLPQSLVFGLVDDASVAHAVRAGAVTGWRAGEWHSVACTWDAANKRMALALDGVLASETPTYANKGSWHLDADAVTTIRLGGWGNMSTPLDGAIDNFRIFDAWRTLSAAQPLKAALPPDELAGLRRQAVDALAGLEGAIRRAEADGLDASYARAVASAARVGAWRMVQSRSQADDADTVAYCNYMVRRCADAAQALVATAADRTWEKRVPRPSVLDLHVSGDSLRTPGGDEVLLIGIRNVESDEFAELSTFFNLVAWGSGQREPWLGQARTYNLAGQVLLFWGRKLPKLMEAYPEMRNVGGWTGHNWADGLCVESPRTRQAIEAGLTALPVVRRGEDPAAAYLLLSAEDQYMCWCDRSQAQFRTWLAQRYGGIDDVNRTWGTSAKSFDELSAPRLAKRGIEPPNRAAWYDWQQFNRSRTTAFYALLKSWLRRTWPTKPVCGGAHVQLVDNRWGTQGVDPEGLNERVNDVIQAETVYYGPTAAVAWDQPPYGMDLFAEALLDFQRSTCGKPATDLEFHAWLHYCDALSKVRGKLPANYTHTAILRHFLHGIRAANIWVWNRKPAALTTSSAFAASSEIPLESVEECLRGALDVRRLSAEIIALSRANPQVAVLISDASFMQVPPETARGQARSPMTAELENVLHGSMFLDAPIGFVSERSIARGALAEMRVVLVPAISHLDDATLAALLDFAEKGGTLVVTPRSWQYDEHHRARAAIPGLPRIDGISFVGLLEKPNEAQLTNPDFVERQTVRLGDPRTPTVDMTATGDALLAEGEKLAGAGIRLRFFAGDAQVVARFDDGSPGLVRIGRGAGCIYSCALPLRPQSYARLLDAVITEAGIERLVRVRAPSGQAAWGVEARSCRYGDDVLVYALNLLAEPVECELTGERRIEGVHDLLAHQPGTTTLQLEGLGAALLRLKVAQ